MNQLKEKQRAMVIKALKANDWNIAAAGRSLRVKRTTLSMMMSRMGIKRPGGASQSTNKRYINEWRQLGDLARKGE